MAGKRRNSLASGASLETAPNEHVTDVLENLLLGTAAFTGKSFFPALLEQLSRALGTTHALLSEVSESGAKLRPIAFWNRGQFAPMPEFDWRGSACGSVLESAEIRYYPTGVQQLFSSFKGLAALGVDSYLGAPLPGPGGEPVGTLCVMGERPLADEKRAQVVFRIFAARAGAELRRVRAEEKVRAEMKERARAEAASRAQVAVVTKTLNSLTAGRDVDQAIGHVLRIIADEFQARVAELWVEPEDDKVPGLHIINKGGRVSAENDLTPSGPFTDRPDSTMYQTLYIRQQCVVLNSEQDRASLTPYLSRVRLEHTKTILLVPLVLGGKAIGCLACFTPKRRRYRADELDLAKVLAHQATLAILLTRLSAKAREMAVLEERTRISRDIHDSLAQSFTGIVVHQEALLRLTQGRRGAAKEHIEATLELARTGLVEARRSIEALRRSDVGDGDLTASLRRLVERSTRSTGVSGDFAVHGLVQAIPVSIGEHLLGVAQEALTNVLRHAAAKHLRIELAFGADAVRLMISDDGCGFDVRSATAGFGLRGMRERTNKFDGQLEILSKPGDGTKVIASALLDSNIAKPKPAGRRS
jgi:signal transduction histidine kinase